MPDRPGLCSAFLISFCSNNITDYPNITPSRTYYQLWGKVGKVWDRNNEVYGLSWKADGYLAGRIEKFPTFVEPENSVPANGTYVEPAKSIAPLQILSLPVPYHMMPPQMPTSHKWSLHSRRPIKTSHVCDISGLRRGSAESSLFLGF